MTWWTHDGTQWRRTYTPTRYRAILGEGAQFHWDSIVRAYVYQDGTWYRFHPEQEPTGVEILSGMSGTVNVGQAFTVTGRVVTQYGTIAGGTVRLKQGAVGSAESTWTTIGTTTAPSGTAASTWSMQATAAFCGPSEFKVYYEGTPSNGPSETAKQGTPTVAVAAPLKPVGTGIPGTTTCSFSWAAVVGATSYSVFRQVGTGTITTVSTKQTGLTYSATGLTAGTIYKWTVKAHRDTCTSAASPTLTGQQAVSEIRDTGTMTTQINSEKGDSWRPDVGWGYLGGEIAQGYYSSTDRRYSGTIDYGGATVMKNKCVALLGNTGRFDNGTVTGARVYLFRKTGGSGASVTYSFYHSTAEAGAVDVMPPRAGTVVNVASTATNAGKWYDVGAAHGLAVAKASGGTRSIVLYDDGSSNADYAINEDRTASAESCDISLDWSWDYVSQPAVVGKWT